MFKKGLLSFIFLFFFFNLSLASEKAFIEIFSPQGTVKKLKQVKVRFSEQMVTFGDPKVPEPFEIKCPVKGKGIWIDEKTWIYDFDKELPAGIRCEFNIKPELKTLSGKTITGSQKFLFSTGGPSIADSYPSEGAKEINENQAFILTLDAEPDEDSVISNAYCLIEGIKERVGIKIIKGEDRKKILNASGYKDDSQEETPKIVVQCKRSFPNNSEVRFIWDKGIKSLSGVETEKEQILKFKTREDFNISFRCTRENSDSGCIPLLPMRLVFSSPVPINYAEKIILKGGGKTYKPSKYKDYYSDDNDKKLEFVTEVEFKGPFPEKTNFTIEIPKDIKDDDGRIPVNLKNFPLKIKTEAYPPLAKFSARFGIIELNGNSMLPVTLRNLEPEIKTRMFKFDEEEIKKEKTIKEKIIEKATEIGEAIKSILPDSLVNKDKEGVNGKLYKVNIDKESRIINWLKIVERASRRKPILKKDSEVKEFYLPKPGGAKAFEVVGIPLKEPGFYVIELESNILGSSLLGQNKTMYVQTAALVTNLSVHFKWGKESSLVWVTTLDKAEPVKDAEVTIRACNGRLIWSGKTDFNGIAYIKQQLPESPSCQAGKSDEDNYYDSSQLKSLRGIYNGYFVFAKKGKDISFVHSNWDDGIETWRFRLPETWEYGNVVAHTIFDRMLLRAGETLHMKHIIRKRTMTGFGLLSNKELPDTLLIQHQGSEQEYEFPIKWDKNRTAESFWNIPKDAKLGHYEVFLVKKGVSKKKESEFEDSFASGSFRMEEFRVPLLKALIKPLTSPLVNVSSLDLDIMVTYLSGGGYSNGKIKLRGRMYPKRIIFDDYEDFTFSNGRLEEGVFKGDEYEYEIEQEEEKQKQKVYSQEVKLDSNGGAKATITGLAKISSPKDMQIEVEFRDPNGEIQTVSTKLPIYPSNLLIGISPDSWAASKDNFKFKVLVLDLSGKPVPDVSVKVDILQKKYYSHRKKLIGGFYSYEHVKEIKRIAEICEGKTDAKGFLICEVKSPVSGNIVLQAYASDNMGNVATVHRDVWIVDKEQVWFELSDSDRIDILPEKKRYEPGEKAKLQVRMPFREATALITVEREGILDTYIKKISGKNPTVEIPIKSNYAPNVFISVFCIRGRVSDIKPTATVDLGKPAFKLGYAEIKVGWSANELKVNVSTDKNIYKVRQKVYAKIKVTKKDGSPLPEKGEVTVAVVDEGLLELMPNKSWRLLDSMMGRRANQVRTSTAQMQVIGKRHFGLKALPHGGGGGKQITRELFDTLLLWKGRVLLNDKGEALVEIPLNDSLTSFRIVAVAQSGVSLFGTGETSIRTTQEFMLISGLPPFVREGDKFRAGFTLRNTTENKMEFKISAFLNGEPLSEINETISAGEAKEIGWDVKVPYGVKSLTWEVLAEDKQSGNSDRLKTKQIVGTAIPVKTFQATLKQIEQPLTLELEKPKDAILERGGIRLSFNRKISDGLDGVNSFMRDYSYTCMEQKISRAIALEDKALWDKVLAEIPSYLDSDGLLKYFASMTYGSETLTSYILSISHEAGWSIPVNIRNKMIEGLKNFIEGKILRYSSLQTADLSIRKISAIEAISRYEKVSSKVLDSINIYPELLPTGTVLDWINILLRVPDIPEREKKLNSAQEIIRSRLDLRGTKLSFSNENRDRLWWLMVSGDLNAVRSILTFINMDSWKDDIPKLVNGTLARLKNGYWDTTTANAWGVLAMKKFSKKFESQSLSGDTIIKYGDAQKVINWSNIQKGQSFNFRWASKKDKLSIEHKGEGKPWVTIQSLVAMPLKESISNGYKIKKKIIPIEQKEQQKFSIGDIVKISLEIEAQSDMTWVVVNDPIPAGATILRTGLGRDSEIISKENIKYEWLFPVFEERSFEAYSAYYDFLPKGKWTLEYIIRFNNAGVFNVPQTRVEAIYYPEMFGEIPNKTIEIMK